jgi:hypothetical protein
MHLGGVGRRARSTPSTHALSGGESAWLAALPCALALLALVLLLGPPLGQAVFEPTGANDIWARSYRVDLVRPEPTEHARYVLALLGPVLMVSVASLLRGRALPAVVPAIVTPLAQIVLVAFVAVCIVAQHEHVYERRFSPGRDPSTTTYFTVPTLVAAVVLALLIALALSRPSVVERIVRATREAPLRRALAIAVAGLLTLAYLLSAFNTDGTIFLAQPALWIHMAFWVDEAASILNGQAPLVDFHAQYGHLWAYVAAGGMALLGTSLGVFAALMLAATAASMAAVFATLRRIVGRSSLLTLALFAPFLATSFFTKLGPLDNRYSPASLFSLFPMRYAGPYVLLWLLVRRLDSGLARRPLPLLAFGALVAINNPEFGIPAVVATLAALAWTLPDRSPRGLVRLAADAVGGGAIAVLLVSALTLAVGGELPHFGMLLLFPRIFGVEGFGLLPMPSIGFHLVVYVTFVAAIVVAVARGLAREDRVVSVALGWIGVFGLGVGAYFAGRSHPYVLIDLFSVWSYALALLTVVAIRATVRRPGRRPQLADLLVYAGLGVMICSLMQLPDPRSQIDRVGHSQPQEERLLGALGQVIDARTDRGEPVAMLVRYGHRISEEIGIADVTPYANIESMMTEQQWAETIEALERAHGRKLFVQREALLQEHIDWLADRGYKPYVEWETLALLGFIKGRPPGAPGR